MKRWEGDCVILSHAAAHRGILHLHRPDYIPHIFYSLMLLH